MKMKWTFRLPLIAAGVDAGIHLLTWWCWVLGRGENPFRFWIALHVPISRSFDFYYIDDFPTSYLLLTLMNTGVFFFLIGFGVDLFRELRRKIKTAS
jgi:hypothetical protein